MRTIDEAGKALIKGFEACKLKAYRDGGGVLTIGLVMSGTGKMALPDRLGPCGEWGKFLAEAVKWWRGCTPGGKR